MVPPPPTQPRHRGTSPKTLPNHTWNSGGDMSAFGAIVKCRAFAIRAEVDMPDGRFVREAVVRLTDDPAQPYWLLAWR